jgi:hypothetical protein
MGVQQTQTLQIPQTYATFVHNASSEKLDAELISLEKLLYGDDFLERTSIAAKIHFVKSILSAQRATKRIVQKLLEK